MEEMEKSRGQRMTVAEFREEQIRSRDRGLTRKGAKESRVLGGGNTFLQNATIKYLQMFDDLSPGGRGRQRERIKEVTVKDYNHFRNLYIKMTGNGSVPSNMMNMRYEKDGKVYNLRPPRLRTDRQGNLIEMKAPKIEGYNARTVRNRVNRAQFEKQGLRALQAKNDLLRQEFNSSVVKGLTNYESFMPLELLQRKNETGIPLHRDLSAQERLAATDHAIANIQALNRSDITREQIEERGKWLSIEDNQDIFNMAGGKYQTRAEKIDLLQEGAEKFGKQPWQMMPTDSQVFADRHRHFALATNAELDAALQNLSVMEQGGDIGSGPISGIGSTDSMPLEGRALNKSGRTKDLAEGYSSGIVEFLSKNGITDLNQMLFSIHQIDRTAYGKISLKYTLPDGSKKTISTRLSGGPMNAVASFDLGLDVAHSNTNDASALELYNYSEQASMEGKEYVIFLSVLSEENSFGNPRVFNFAMNFVKKYLSDVNNPKGPEAQQFIKGFNTALQQRLSKGEITRYSHSENLDPKTLSKEKLAAFQDFQGRRILAAIGGKRVVERTDGLRYGKISFTNTSGNLVEFDQMLEIETQEGLFALIDMLQDSEVTNSLGFSTRRLLAEKTFAKQGGGKIKGVPSQKDFLSVVNEDAVNNANTKDIVTAVLVDTKNADQSNNLKKAIGKNLNPAQKNFVDGMTYTTGLMGVKDATILEETISSGRLQQTVARQKTGGVVGFEKSTATSKIADPDIAIGVNKAAEVQKARR